MKTTLSQYDAKSAKPWQDNLGYTVEYGDPIKTIADAGTAHKKVHSAIVQAFWYTRYQVCEFDAILMTWEGNPFDLGSRSRWAAAVDKRLIIQEA